MDVDFQRQLILRESDLRRAIEPQGKINRISHRNERAIDSVGQDIKRSEWGLALDGGKGPVNGVETMGDFDSSDPRNVEAGIEDTPLMLQVDLEVGVEIHW